MIYILYSADYELFLRENYVLEKEVLVDPTERLLGMCDSLGAPVTLFCDVACLWRYRELNLNEFPEEVEKQLKSAIWRGHDVQAHVHPHWLKAIKAGNRWIYDYEDFLVGNISGEVECYVFAKGLFRRAADYLNKLLRPVDASYRCIAFRAGGYGLQPKEHQILAALQDSGYTIDSSIVTGLKLSTNVNKIDFANVPQKSNYYLSSETGLQGCKGKNGIFEIPIPMCRESSYLFLKRRLSQTGDYCAKLLLRIQGKPSPRVRRGAGIQSLGPKDSVAPSSAIKKKMLAVMKPSFLKLELNSRPASRLMWVTRKYLQGFDSRDDIYFSFSCHPKSIFDEDLEQLVQYHNLLLAEYGERVRAITYQEANRRISID